MQQSYDGNGLRVKKVENGVTTYYLRSSVLGGQVAAELNGSGAWMRGYVYLGGELLAVQQSGVYWMHQEPVAKSKRVTAGAGNVVSTVELDPWGGDTSRSSNPGFQPRRFTSYERDGNGSDEAMFRRYNRWQSRFDQPDPYDGSYSLAAPQSFNRYAYVQNDPVNFTDPSGLDISLPLPFFHGPAPIGPPPSTVTIYGSFNSPLGSGGGVGVSDRDLMLDLVNIGTLSGGGHTPQDTNKTIEQAFLDAGTVLLQDKDCARFFGARTKNQREKLVTNTLDSLRQNARTANIDFLARTTGTGRSAIISFGPQFFGDAAFRVSTSGSTDPRQGRAHTVLHELAHALRRIPKDGPGFPSDQHAKNDKSILDRCSKGLSKL